MYRMSRMLVIAGIVSIALASCLCAAETPAAKPAAKPAAPKPAVEPDDGIQGEYAGTYSPVAAAAAKAEAKVIGEGGGSFRVVLTAEGEKPLKVELTGKADGKKVPLTGKAGDVEWQGMIEGGQTLVAESKDGKADLKWFVRKSPTEGEKPPAGAIVLLPFEEGKKPSLDAWVAKKGGPAAWVPQDDGSVLIVGGGDIQTKQEFTNVRLHVEFMSPYMPAARGQGRGNSGVYLQSRYEVQVLDSFGLKPQNNECGAIYTISAPRVNASLPPGRWQTYDITFHAPTVVDGKVTKPATMSVVHNGIEIQKDVKVDQVTRSGVGGAVKSPAPLLLQDHTNPVRYRNVWLVEQKD
jgi:hypothetical protein